MRLRNLLMRITRPALKLSRFDWGQVGAVRSVFGNPLAVSLRFLELKGVRDPFYAEMRPNLKIRARTGDDLVCIWDCWIKEDYRLAGDEKIIIDAGANIGAFSIYAFSKCPRARIFAFEPVASTHSDLAANLSLNGLAGPIEALKIGVAGASGERDIAAAGASPYSSLYRPGDGGAQERIRVESLEGIFRAIGNPAGADVLKMDCEGAEMECLLAADRETLRRCGRILIEYHEFSGIAYGELEKHLLAAGFAGGKRHEHAGYGVGIAWFDRQG